MQPAIRNRLLEVNREFYQRLARPFAATRPRPQPGVERLLERIGLTARVLDVGCGHGLVAERLQLRGFHGTYVGLDSSRPLIELARGRVTAQWATFAVGDLAQGDWPQSAVAVAHDWVLAFAVLHHIPGAAARADLARRLGSVLRDGGQAAVSVWDFAGNERFRERLLDWETIGLRSAEVEPGDFLVDWREGGRGVRYVHHFSSEELADLAQAAGLAVAEEFRSDGEGGRLGLYQLWESQQTSAA